MPDGAAPHPRDLFLAIRHGEADRVAELLARGADPNWSNRRGDETALAYAARVSIPDVVRVLLAHGATDHGHMPLGAAASFNREWPPGMEEPIVIARLLLEHSRDVSADVNRQDEYGWTPLMEAVSAGDAPLIRLLLEHGADPHARTRQGTTLADVARANGHTPAALGLSSSG